MSRKGFALFPLFILALAVSASAQEGKPVTTVKENADTMKITVSGDIVVDYVWRSGALAAYTTRIESTAGAPRDENTFEGELGVRLDIDLSNKVSAVLQIGRERVDSLLGNPMFLPFVGGVQSLDQEIVIREMRVHLKEFLTPELSLQVGIPTWSFDVRGRGNAFAFDPRRAQSFSHSGNWKATEDVTGTLDARCGQPDELDPVGAVLTYGMQELTLDLVFLPMVIEGGPPSEDEALYAVDVWFNLERVGLGKGSRVGGILALNAIQSRHSGIFTLGGGAALKEIIPGLELYGEVYFQFGDAGHWDPPGPVAEDLKAAGMALQVGAQINFGGDLNPWLGFNLTMVSGDDDDDADDDSVDSFLSYENINDLIIIEDMYFGLDWDTNYFALKFSGGLAFSVGGGKNNLEISAILGICKTMEDVQIAGSGEDALGTEFDARLKWHITPQATLQAAIGFLFGSDILEETMDAAGDEEEDSAILYTVGASLRF